MKRAQIVTTTPTDESQFATIAAIDIGVNWGYTFLSNSQVKPSDYSMLSGRQKPLQKPRARKPPKMLSVRVNDLVGAVEALATGKNGQLHAVRLLSEYEIPEACRIASQLAVSADPEIRMRAMELLGQSCCTSASRILIAGLKDKDLMVRSSAADSLGLLLLPVAKQHLIRSLRDSAVLVRSSAALALAGYNDQDAIVALSDQLAKESNRVVKLRLYAALYSTGNPQMLPKVLKFLDDSNYQNRCAAASILDHLVKRGDIQHVRSALKRRLVIETTMAARSSITNAIAASKGLKL